MIKKEYETSRSLKAVSLDTELAIIGGGLSGVCTAITAARKGVKVVLVQDRPVLGGNSSSEVRLWILGATSHMGNNNRWSREGGVIDEILVENTYKNKEGNPLIFDVILLDKVKSEPNITLLLNTAVYEVHKSEEDTIDSIKGFCSQNSIEYTIHAPLFCDASGDGIVGFLSGAAFRMGAESQEEFGEKFAPSKEYGELLGHSLYFYTKDTGRPVKYTAPSFATDVTTEIPRFRSFNAKEYGCKLWWLEYGGRLDTVHDTEEIKWELWKVAYGAWDYIKNSGQFPEAENLTLEWVGTIPGKRESRRFEGDYIMRQQDVVEQRIHEDAVAYGGWSLDLHPADGVFSEKPGCNQWHAKGIYQIPFRSLYSKNIKNLFLAGRIISATHVAFASTRVMATSAHVGQAIGMAAYIAKTKGADRVEALVEVSEEFAGNHTLQISDRNTQVAIRRSQYLNPREILEEGFIPDLQRELLKKGQHIPGLELQDDTDLVQQADIIPSSVFELEELRADLLKPLAISTAQMLPLEKGKIPALRVKAQADSDTVLRVEWRVSEKIGNYTPDVVVETQAIPVKAGENDILLECSSQMPEQAYAFVMLHKNEAISLYHSEQRITGILSVYNLVNKAVSNFGKQTPPEDIGVHEFEFWCPQRRPEGHNLALQIESPLTPFGADQLKTGVFRPTTAPNAWVASPDDVQPHVTLHWTEPKTIRHIDLFFDTDYDHPMESVLMGHPEDVMPFCVRNYKIVDADNRVVFEKIDNYQTINHITLEESVTTNTLTIFVEHPSENVPAAVFAIRCYS
ncbi:FAD-dependent oxidoreductase [Sphingobacterium sp. SGG-5]|uniref:FAD-dependent oxidoreductase n=1 Tax=Sphingobacterium sp. SGG-5 TaxID=2710881 RepID=UPI0013EC0DB3|nr:FAD-dependent oxidoreductase [Sphingobacterium sp. SGG-5]NGM61488.1 FAD-dependent oxidoreductase [Sphingobacterium sp. SGG-5]